MRFVMSKLHHKARIDAYDKPVINKLTAEIGFLLPAKLLSGTLLGSKFNPFDTIGVSATPSPPLG